MKLSGILRVAVLALPLVLASCGSKKKTVQPQTTSQGTIEKANFIEHVQGNAQTAKFITSKVKFSVEVCGGRPYRTHQGVCADYGPYQQTVSEGTIYFGGLPA